MRPEDSTRQSILIIDDDEQVRGLLKDVLGGQNDCTTAESAEEALKILTSFEFDLVISDIMMGGISGLDLVPRVLARTPDTVVVMISGQQTIDFAIDAMRAGAFDYITKPLDLRHVEGAVHRALLHHDLLTHKRRYESHLEELVRERTAEIELLAYHDRLTNLPNRTLFIDRCNQALAIAQRNHNMAAVLLVSLDRFKKVTESLGHAPGDELLAEAGARLLNCINEGDTVGRFDGDEFALLSARVKETAELTAMTQAISQAFKQPFRVGGQEVFMTTSIGISLFPQNGEDSNTILRNAGAALYRAKRQGGNNCQFYAADMNAEALRRLALDTSSAGPSTTKSSSSFISPV